MWYKMRRIVIVGLMLCALVCGVGAADSIVAWGLNDEGQCDIPEELKSADIIDISAGAYHSMALTSDGTVHAWGDNSYGQCDVPEGLQAIAIACGGYHSLALDMGGYVHAWGSNIYNESRVYEWYGGKHTAVSAYYYASMALSNSGVPYWVGTPRVWGRNSAGLPYEIMHANTVKVATATGTHFALLDNNTVYAWGNNAYGLCDVPEGLQAIDIDCSEHALALTTDGEVVGWGHYYDPPPAPLARKVIAITCSDWSSACIFDDYSVYVWGDLEYEMDYNYGQHDPPLGLRADMIDGGYCHFIARTVTVPAYKPAPTLQWSPDTGYYTGYWFNRDADFINVEGLFSAILLPFTALIGQWFFMILWGTLVMGMYLHSQDTTLPFVIGILLGAVISMSAGADGVTVMYLTMAFAGGGVLAKVLLGRL